MYELSIEDDDDNAGLSGDEPPLGEGMGDEFNFKFDMHTGEVSLNLRDLQNILKETRPSKSLSDFSILVNEHLGDSEKSISKCWHHGMGLLILSTLDEYLDQYYCHLEIESPELSSQVFSPLELSDDIPPIVVMTRGVRVLVPKSKSDKKHNLIMGHSVDHDGDIRLTIHYSSENQEARFEAAEVLKELQTYHWDNSPLRGRVFDMSFKVLKRDERSISDLTLNESTRRLVQLHILDYISSLDNLRDAGLSTNRGVILSGPPGTGKTLIVKDTIAQTSLTTIVVTTAMLARHLVNEAYRLARKFAPAIVVLEDIDSAGGISRKLGDHPILGEVLQALNGIESNEGVITIATTNFNENLDEALRDRPGRFDMVIRVGVPEAETRRRLLNRLFKRYSVESDIDIDALVRQTEGLTGAWIDELVKTALQYAIITDNSKTIRQIDLNAAVKDIRERRSEAANPTGLLSDLHSHPDVSTGMAGVA